MKHSHFVSVLFLSVALLGCGSGSNTPAGMPPLFSTAITIVQEGVPLAGASVVLIPDDGSQDWYVVGATDASGVAEMMASSRWSGSPKGKYKVIVRKFESDPSQITPVPDDADEAARNAYDRAVSNERLNSYVLVEPVFSDPDKTPLTLTVDGKTTETFDVGKAVKILTR
jgi:hypothetical protein